METRIHRETVARAIRSKVTFLWRFHRRPPSALSTPNARHSLAIIPSIPLLLRGFASCSLTFAQRALGAAAIRARAFADIVHRGLVPVFYKPQRTPRVPHSIRLTVAASGQVLSSTASRARTSSASIPSGANRKQII